MKKDLVSKVLAIVFMAGLVGFYAHRSELADIAGRQQMTEAELVKEALTPSGFGYKETIILSIACGVTIVILTELVGFFIRISFFRKIDEVKVVHNHNITIQMPENCIVEKVVSKEG